MTPWAKHLEAAARCLRDAGGEPFAVKVDHLAESVAASERTCEHCGTLFIARHPRARFCSDVCRVSEYRKR